MKNLLGETENPEIDEAALAKLWQNGREAWKDVPDAAAWVEDLRGNAGDGFDDPSDYSSFKKS